MMFQIICMLVLVYLFKLTLNSLLYIVLLGRFGPTIIDNTRDKDSHTSDTYV